MKKALNIGSLVVLTVALVQLARLCDILPRSQPLPIPTPEPKAAAFADFPLNVPRTVDLEVDEDTLTQFTPREQLDQIRDWLLFTVVSAAGLSTDEINQSLFDLPAIRYGYTQPVGNFEYGETRSRAIGDGKIIALLPPASAAVRLDHLAHIADEQRKNSGEIPVALLVFTYDIDMAQRAARLTRHEAVNAREFFTAGNGYYESAIGDPESLWRFLAQVDDITFAEVNGQGLKLGGRKLQSRAYRGIRVEDVAAIWQAEEKLQATWQAFSDKWQQAIDLFNARWRTKTYSSTYEKIRLEQQYDKEWEQLQEQRQRELKKLGLVQHSGFSLDPAYDYNGLKSFFETELAPQLRGVAVPSITVDDIQQVELGLTRGDQQPCLALAQKLSKSTYDYAQFLGEILVKAAKEFSITPGQNDTRSFADVFTWFKIPLRDLLSTPIAAHDIDTASLGISETNIVPYLEMIEKLKKYEEYKEFEFFKLLLEHKKDDSENKDQENFEEKLKTVELQTLQELIRKMAEATEKTYRFQGARYDGELQGTEIGMVLFYTDLLAKLWALDYHGNAPSSVIEDFPTMTSGVVSPIYRQELRELPSTRLWFGPQDKGFQVANRGTSLLFARTATRIYAASSNPLKPGVEAEPNAESAAFLGWWDTHYEEVARYEPEYERLNEIMKWSLLISWLNEAKHHDLLAFLTGDSIAVDHAAWFPKWVQQHAQLRFHDWDKIGFNAPGYKGVKTETLPILFSAPYSHLGEGEWVLSGGVSLASKQLFKERGALAEGLSVLSRRANLDYRALSQGSLRTLGGTRYTFKSVLPKRAAVFSAAKDGAKLRGRISDLVNVEFERIVSRQGAGLAVETRAAGTELGRLNIARAENGFKIGWRSRDIDLGQSLARRLSTSANPDSLLLGSADVETAIKLAGDRHYLVKMSGMDRWLKIAPEEQASAQIASGWQSRVADVKEGAQNLQLAWVEAKSVQNELKEGGYIVAESSQSTGQNLLRYEPIRGPPPAEARPVEIQSGNITLKGHTDPNTGTMYFRTEDLPPFVRDNPTRLQQILRQPQTPVMDNSGVVQQLRHANYDEAAPLLAQHPREMKLALEQHLAEQLRQDDDLLAAGHYVKARQHLYELSAIYGEWPELQLRQAIVGIRQGKLEEAAQVLNTGKSKLSHPEEFLDEINERLSHSTVSSTEDRVMAFTDWRDLQARHLVPPGEVRMVREGDQLVIHYSAAEVPIGNPVLPKDIDLNTAFIYVQDSPGLNNLDWQAGLGQSLDQAVSGRLATVIHLPRDDIAHFHPTAIYTPDQTTRFNNVSQGSKTSFPKTGYQSFRPMLQRQPDCQGDQTRPDCPHLPSAPGQDQGAANSDALRPQVYVVIATPSAAAQR